MIINTENLTSLSKEDREAVEKCAQSTYQYQKQSMEQFHKVWAVSYTHLDVYKRQVLVVDDEKLIVKGIRFSLEQDGMEVDCA